MIDLAGPTPVFRFRSAQQHSNMSVQHMHSASSGMPSHYDIPDSPVGYLCRDLPAWVSNPPIESVVFAWGASEDHQLGLDTEQDIYQPKVVESLLGIHFMGRSFGACPLVGGSRNTLALDADGGLWSWGWNDRGTLGHGHRALQRKPAPVQGLAGVEVVQAAIGGWHCLALDSAGQVYCWGGNEYQQCGLVSAEDAAVADAQPGNSSSSNGGGAQQQQQWMYQDSRGQLLPQDSRGRRWQRGSNGALIAGGAYGVLPAARDILVPLKCMPGLKVKQVACGGMNSVVLCDSGEVWTWGEPWGDFMTMDVQRAPRKVEGAVNIAAIACGAFHNLALVADGSVLSWGTNDYGQLGNGSTIYSTTPVEVVDLEDVAVADIAAGGWHSMALTADGQIYVWGRGEYGRLGIGDRTGSSKLRPHKVRGVEEHVAVQVAAGGTHSLCVTSSGRMFIWGRASYGRLGLGQEARDCYSPVEVQLPGGHQRWRIAAATAGGRHTMCLAVPVRDGLKGSSLYGGSEGGQSRAASLVNEPITYAQAASSRGNGSAANGTAAAGGAGLSQGQGGQQQQQDSQQESQQQQQQSRMFDPFATQLQQGGQQGRSTPAAATDAEHKAAAEQAGSDNAAGSCSAAGAGAGAAAAADDGGDGSRRGLAAVSVGSPYQPGGALPHGPALSMQSSYSFANSPGSSILGGGSPPGVVPAVVGPGGLAVPGTNPWLGALPSAVTSTGSTAAAAAAAAEGPVSAAERGRHTAAIPEEPSAAGVQGDQGSAAAAAAGYSSPPHSSVSGRGAAAAGSSSGAGGAPMLPVAAAAMAAAAAAAAAGGSIDSLPLGVEAVHAATEAAVQQVSARLHGLLPASSAGSGSLTGMLISHGPLAAAAAAGAAHGGGLRSGQGSSVSPRGMPPPMSPSQRAVGVDPGSSLREFVNTGDAYDVSGRGDSLMWQHQEVLLDLQDRYLIVEDEAIQAELQEDQQREADEAAAEEAEEAREEEVRLRRQEQQQQLREAQLRQQQQQQMLSVGSGPMYHQAASYTGLGLFAPGSNGSNGGRPGSSHGHLGYAAGSSGSNVLLQHMRRSHSHQQLTDPLDVVAAAAAVGLSGGGTQSDSYALQRHSSSPPIGVALSSSIQQHGGDRSGNTRSSSGSRQGGAAGPSAAAAAAGPAGRSPSGPVTVPGFNPSMGGARRGMTRVESDVSQEGLVGPDSLREGPARSETAGRGRHAGSAAAGGISDALRAGSDSLRASRGSASSISGDSTSGQGELGASPPSGRYDVGLGERYAANSLPGREQLHHLAHT